MCTRLLSFRWETSDPDGGVQVTDPHDPDVAGAGKNTRIRHADNENTPRMSPGHVIVQGDVTSTVAPPQTVATGALSASPLYEAMNEYVPGALSVNAVEL